MRIEMKLKGREKAHQDLAKEKLENFLKIIPVGLKKEEEINKIRKDGKKIIDKIREINSVEAKTNAPTFRIIQGIENITSQIECMLENNTEVLVSMGL